MAKSPVFHGIPFHGPQPAETKVLLMKNISVVVIGMVLLVSSFALSLGSMTRRPGPGAGFAGNPIPPACFPSLCASALRLHQ
jgi:hypothetical protein